ncbi:IS1182 family transposase [Persicobacter diffluens]|uniref:IS1182 family transposase n=1 Tax=Persicobacter diffluens TaxID=981 RepID=A0AAN4W3D3_9BACT|nr:hypothetical protein PEDI_37970 [Persicobacter diffluens]
MINFRGGDRKQYNLMPHDVNDWLPENHLARFVVEIIDQLNLSSVYASYKGYGKDPYDPRLLLGLIFYGYCTGIFSSRKIEAATYDSVAFRFIAGNLHPDHDTITNFRKTHLDKIEDWFVEILMIGSQMGLVKMGNVFVDGTKIQANASKHKAMSYKRALELEKKLKAEIATLLEKAAEQDEEEVMVNIPEEIARREERLKKIQEAKATIESRRKEAYEDELKDYEKKVKKREEKARKTGQKPRGRSPQKPSETPQDKDQVNFTDKESRIMKSKNGFEQCYNAQAVANEDMVIVGQHCNNHANDKKELLPAIDSVPESLKEEIEVVAADCGYYSDDNIKGCPKGITPIVPKSKAETRLELEERLNNRTTTEEEIYRKRKYKIEPIFGIIKEALGFRRFSFRGEKKVSQEWGLVCLCYNIRRLLKLKVA